ncbi:MAG: MFS transporter [Actinobacteria bacterium]|nr:MAG: MFS transporter [Actinomycetota bacterium]
MRVFVRSTFQSLQIRNYRLFATGQLISLIFGWVQITAQDWLVLELSHGSASALGVVTALQFAPMLLFTLYAGKLADRFDKRYLLIVANLLWFVLAALMGALVVSGAVLLWQVYVFAALWGVVTAVETPVRQSFVSELVGKPLLPNAMSLNAATFNTARILGPALAGLTIAALGTGTAFVVNAASYVFPVVALARLRAGELHRENRQVSAAEARVVDGLRYVWRRHDLLLPVVLILVVGMVGFNYQLTLPVLAKNVFHTGAATFGLLVTALAAGALMGALAGTRRRARPSAWLVLGAAIGYGALGTLAGFMPTYGLTALVMVPTGFAQIFLAQAANQRVQLGTDAEMRGRVMALYILAFLGTNPIGAPLVGWFAEVFGPRASIWAGGAISLAAALAALLWQLRRSQTRIRLRLRPTPGIYLWQGEAHGVPTPAGLPGR